MENLSQPLERVTVPLDMPVPGYLRDHHVGSLVVLPAVEALQILARSKPAAWGADPCRQAGALFHHPFVIAPEDVEIRAFMEHARYAGGSCLSRLTSLRRLGGLSRRMEHLAVRFVPAEPEDGGGRRHPLPDPTAAVSPGEAVFRISGSRLYEELVPFGPAYRNARGDILLTPDLVLASVYGGDFPGAEGPLGSPFPLDGAMHAACAWGQRYRNRVVFPVGFDQREILCPTGTGETYPCRIIPLTDEGPVLRFDLYLYGPEGRLAEAVRGLQMREILGGKRTPPAWVREGRCDRL